MRSPWRVPWRAAAPWNDLVWGKPMRALRAVLFDLDDTLLRTDTGAFLSRYFGALSQFCSTLIGADRLPACVLQACERMAMRAHPEETNAEAFCREFSALTGLRREEFWPAFERFYAEIYPTLRGEIGPMPGAREAILAARGIGCKVAIATNPLFPEQAVRARLEWGGLADLQFDLVTALENMHYVKPQPEYYEEIASLLGVLPAQCLMVGNDPEHDIVPAREAGMRTYLVHDGCEGLQDTGAADRCGTLEQLALALRGGGLAGCL